MKKTGFTLAEILVTMAIVGVVAALTIPSLNVNVSQQKIGPTLAKFSSEYENAVKAYLLRTGRINLDNVANLSSVWEISNVSTNNHPNTYGLKSGGQFQVRTCNPCYCHIVYDINGFGNGNDSDAVDTFHFMADYLGHLYPVGSASLIARSTQPTLEEKDIQQQIDVLEAYKKKHGSLDEGDTNTLGQLNEQLSDLQNRRHQSVTIDSIDTTLQTGKAYEASGEIADNGWTTKGLARYK